MFRRLSPAWVAFGGSVVLFGALIAALYWDPFTPAEPVAGEPLVVYCAEAMRVPMEACARDYERAVGQKVDLHFGPSQALLAKLQLSRKGDLFLPADDSYVELARGKDLVAAVVPLARLTAVAVLRHGFGRPVQTWADLVAPGHTLGLANDAAAIGKLLHARLEQLGLWDGLVQRQPTFLGTVNDVANAAQLGSIDVGIVWDVVAHQHPKLTVARLPELDSVRARVQVALTSFSRQPDAARRFLHFVRSRDHGARHFRRDGYSNFDEEESAARAEVVLYAGAMLRPAVEETVRAFEQREGVKVTRVYNGCGILVSQMRAGEHPDLYFACDTRFMAMVRDRFDAPAEVSSNQLVIAVRAGNPLGITGLRDLGRPGLRVGVGHEQQCALGAITRETFERAGVYAAVRKNVVVVSPTGDFLINQLRSGTGASSPSLDAVVAYRSNVTPFEGELEAIPVTGIPCAAPHQPLAVSRSTAHPELSRRLMAALQSDESKARFEKLGFGWKPAPTPAD